MDTSDETAEDAPEHGSGADPVAGTVNGPTIAADQPVEDHGDAEIPDPSVDGAVPDAAPAAPPVATVAEPASEPAPSQAPAAEPPAPAPPPVPRPGEARPPSRAPWILLGVGVVVVVAVLASVVVVTLARSGPGAEPARSEAESFVRAWSAGDLPAMQALVEPASAPVAADLDAALRDLGPVKATVTLAGLTVAGKDERLANVAIELSVPELPPIAYTHTIPLRKVADDNWRVLWSRSVIHPDLTADRRFDQHRTWAPRGALVDVDGQPLASSGGSITIILQAARVEDRPGLEAALAGTLGIDAATIDRAFTAARASGAGGQAPIKTVTRAQFESVRSAIFDIKGLYFASSGGTPGIGGVIGNYVVGTTAPANAERAAALGPPYKEGDEVGVSGLQQHAQKALGGLPATEVRIVDAAGTVVRSIVTVDGSPPANVRTSIDRALQDAAQQAIAGIKESALVVIDREGRVRAMANSNESGTNWATAQYPPGSTMKVVTAAALLAKGLTPETQLTCPPTIRVGGQPFRNFEGETEASLDFTRAFAISCNTAFLGAADKNLTDADMLKAAEQFGFNVDYDLGIPMTVRGSFPNRPGANRAAQAIGQGDVLTNPMHMASVAAAAMTGQWKAPTFLAEPPGDRPVGTPLDPRVHQQLVGFMRANVEFGSGAAAAAPGKVVHGKTGTAEQGAGDKPPTHAWYIGFSGDLAIAVVLHYGGVGGRNAAPVAGRFFAAVP